MIKAAALALHIQRRNPNAYTLTTEITSERLIDEVEPASNGKRALQTEERVSSAIHITISSSPPLT